MPGSGYRSISIPEVSYEGLQKARAEIMLRGTDSIPKELLARCGIVQGKPITMGMLLELGMSALLRLSEEGASKSRKKRS